MYCSFPRAVTKYHNWDGLKHKKSHSLLIPAGWKSQSQYRWTETKEWAGHAPPGVLEKSAPCSFSFWGFRHPRSGVAPPQISPP